MCTDGCELEISTENNVAYVKPPGENKPYFCFRS